MCVLYNIIYAMSSGWVALRAQELVGIPEYTFAVMPVVMKHSTYSRPKRVPEFSNSDDQVQRLK